MHQHAASVIIPLMSACWLPLPLAAQTPSACTTKPYKIEGTSLAPAIANGTILTVTTGPQCPLAKLIRPNSLVIFHNGQASQPVIKQVKALPADTFHLTLTPAGAHLTVNGRTATNSTGTPYLLGAAHARMLNLYAQSYNGTIPPNAYLVMGDNPSGTLDSTRYGLINLTDIIAVANQPLDTLPPNH